MSKESKGISVHLTRKKTLPGVALEFVHCSALIVGCIVGCLLVV